MISFHQVYEQYAESVFRFAYGLCGDESEAGDLTSESFIRLWTHRGSVRAETVKGYLFSITNNLFLKSLRKQHREETYPQNLQDLKPNPEQKTHSKQRFEVTMAAIKQLPENQRAALLLRAYENLPYREIAQCLNTNVAAARVNVHRARMKLLELVDKENPSNGTKS